MLLSTIGLYQEISELSAKVLKPHGSLLVLDGGIATDEGLGLLSGEEGLDYQFLLSLWYGGPSGRVHARSVDVLSKFLLWYAKGGYNGNIIPNGIQVGGITDEQPMEYHKWGQRVEAIKAALSPFIGKGQTYYGGVVLDPMCGAGTTGVAALELGASKFIGNDNEEDAPGCIEVASKRLGELK